MRQRPRIFALPDISVWKVQVCRLPTICTRARIQAALWVEVSVPLVTIVPQALLRFVQIDMTVNLLLIDS